MTDSPNSALGDDPQRRIEAIAEEFLAGLQAGERPDAADVLAAHPDLAEPLKRRLALVERLFRAGQNAKTGDGGQMRAERAHRLKCPHCGNRIQLVEPRPKEITCVNCGSSFRVEPGTTATFRDAGPGGTVGRFEILELLGRGAFGEVYRARDPELDRFVAVKVPRADYFATSEDEQRFLREARSAAGLRHPSIVQVYEIAHERGSPYIVSDFIDGLTLADLISGGQPAFRESAELVAQLADALDYAHRQTVVHRDIKPSNILLAVGVGVRGGGVRSGVVSGRAGAPLDTHYAPFLADFGLARRDEGEITVTLDGQVLGTPAYMSPEQAAGDHARVDGRSDVYSLGVVLYELLSGELPFRGSRRMLLHQVLNDEPRPPRTLNDQIPRDLETICLKAMAKEPARRYLTAADFRDDLRRFLRGDPIAARRVGRPERAWRWCRRNPLPAGLAAAVAAALLIGTIISSYFAVSADELAVAEHHARIAADGSANRARAARAEAIAARDQTVGMLVRGLLVPLTQNIRSSEAIEDLSFFETESFWELSSMTNEGVGLRYLDEGTRDHRSATRLCVRSQSATIAALGLNLDNRDKAAALLLRQVRDVSLPILQRAEAAYVALEIAEQPSPFTDECVDAKAIGAICNMLAATAARMDAVQRSRICSEAAQIVIEMMHSERYTDSRQANLLARDLAVVAAHIEPTDAARLCNEAAHVLIESAHDEGWSQGMTAESLAALAGHMPPADKEGICGAMARKLIEALTIATEVHSLAQGLAAVAGRLEPVNRARVCNEAASVLNDRLQIMSNSNEMRLLAEAIALVSSQMMEADAEHICGDAARALVDALRLPDSGPRQPDRRPQLALGLWAVAARMQPDAREQVCREAAHRLIEVLEQEPIDNWSGNCTGCPGVLPTLAAYVERAESAPHFARAVRNHFNRRRTYDFRRYQDILIARCLPLCDSVTTRSLAWTFARLKLSEGDANSIYVYDGWWSWAHTQGTNKFNLNAEYEVVPFALYLDELLTEADHKSSVAPVERASVRREETERPADADPQVTVIPSRVQPWACRLSTPQLVELLKMPTCFGPVRRVILDHLENRYGRQFNTVWAFVRFAEAEKLALDFTSPPRRPDPATMEIPAP